MTNVIQIIKTFTSTKQHNSILNGRVKFKVFINLHVPVHVDYVKLLNIIHTLKLNRRYFVVATMSLYSISTYTA